FTERNHLSAIVRTFRNKKSLSACHTTCSLSDLMCLSRSAEPSASTRHPSFGCEVVLTWIHFSSLSRGSRDGDCCVADVQKMQVSHLIKKVHLGSPISSIEFCPTER
uniref:Uncharacterized protein n=1 Tax=Aegilops tauschii subsp. strangulata TaxID=200361 RepID=A0A453M402_AEGTS